MKEITNDDLARIIQNSMIELKTDINELKVDVAGLKVDVAGLKVTVDRIDSTLNKKVDKIEYNTLEHRVEKLEEKVV